MSRLKALIPLGLFLGLALLLSIGLTRDPSFLPSEMIDKPFPDFAMSTLYDEEAQIDNSVFERQISLVNVFGSWCAACVQEHPKLMQIGKQGRVQIIGVDWRDTREKGQRWIKRYGNPYTTILFDETSQLAIDLGITGAPETFVVDRTGTIRYKHVGILTDKVWTNKFLPLIAQLEAER